MKQMMHTKMVTLGIASLSLAALAALPSHAQAPTSILAPGVGEYGTEDQMGTGSYSGGFNPVGFDPKAGASLTGVAVGTTTQGAQSGGHTDVIPSPPPAGDFLNTDQIFLGSGNTGTHLDGYSNMASAKKGPAVFTLDYSSLIPAGQTLQTLTLGIAADDFQFGKYGQPFTATINGVVNTTITNKLNNLTLTDPSDLFFTTGIAPGSLLPGNILTLSIDEGGNGGDGFGVDFLTVGVTSAPVPEASTTVSLGLLLALGLGGLVVASRRRKGSASAV